MKDLLFERAAGHQVEDEHLALLADAVYASDPLLDRHRIPWQVEIDERVAELNVAALAARFGAQQHRHVRAETGDGGILFGTAQTSLELRERDAFRAQKLGEVIERIAVLDENQLLLCGISLQQIEQARLLAPASQRRPSPRHRAP